MLKKFVNLILWLLGKVYRVTNANTLSFIMPSLNTIHKKIITCFSNQKESYVFLSKGRSFNVLENVSINR